MLSSLFSSFTVHADAPEAKDENVEESKEGEKEEGGEEEPEPEEEEEPEDVYPAIREECQETKACAGHAKHFQHCQEKVEAGEGYKGEDCVEELMMHCVDNCAAPKLFSKLR
ncbi:hypothetical protein PILCRDRAFT_97586 [Piloderma croceum F 1598]|uniref:Ubiquinol-cytochrome C reductase hinge domain-containing protein n=1 Tax=Piloderma croceum (strain F 1598) TaxID=765440 RepID=A0A0C3FBZ9_PILCF|nr:hypothetical protein PILCRDRAFT_97586 [Piloderma croceum F 1598]